MKRIRIRQRLTAGVILVVACAAMAVGQDEAGILARARQAVAEGRFSDAEALLRPQLADPQAPVVDEYAVTLEIIRRIRLDFPLTPEQTLAQLRRQIPDVTAEEMERWRAQGVLQHRVIDGEVRYFKRAVGNLFRSCKSCQSRRVKSVAPVGWKFDLPAHLARLIAKSEQAGRALVHPVRHRVRYALRVKDGHPRLRQGATVRCWLPFPQEYRQQQSVRLLSAEPAGAVVAPNGHPQRTLYFEQVIEDPDQPPRFVAEFEFVTSAYVPKLDPAEVKPYDKDSELYRTFTAQRPPHIVLTPELRRLANEIVGEESNPLQRARQIFRWVDRNIPWCSEMEYSTIPNLSAKGLSARRGDCGVQGLVFITLCRAAGIPARWQSGWETLPNGSSMHDWSEFYIEPWGWLPADASYGLQEHRDPRVQEFFCGHMDPYRLIVNLDYARELHPPKLSFRSESNDFQRGEIEIDGHNLYFDEWDWSFDVQTTPLDGGLACLEEALDAVVPEALDDGGVCGAVIAIGHRADDGYQTWQKAYGFMQTEPQRVPIRSDAIFDMASMTKPIATGTSIMILAEQGKLRVDDPVGRFLPEFTEGDKKNVTIRHLMTHMSGMPPYVGAAQQKVVREKAGFPCPDEMRAYIRNLALARQPGEAMVYSCLNAILCAEIVEAVSGQPLDRFAGRHIFAPLEMDDTGFCHFTAGIGRDAARLVPTTKAGHAASDDGFLRGRVHDPLAAMQDGVSGNAGLFSTAADLGRFAQMMLNGGELDGVRILKPETIRRMRSVQNPGAVNTKGTPAPRGLLWGVYVSEPPGSSDKPNAKSTDKQSLSVAPVVSDTNASADLSHETPPMPFAFGHGGYTGGAIRIYPEQGIYIIALANRVHPDDSGKVGEFRRQVWESVEAMLMNSTVRR